MYPSKQEVVTQISEDIGFPIPSIELTEDIIGWGMDDPDVFSPMQGIREAISAWLMQCCDWCPE